MQPMLILMPPNTKLFLEQTHSVSPTFCNTHYLQRWSHKDALAPPTWNVKFREHSSNLFRWEQNCIFSFSTQTEDMNIECKSTSYSPHISRKWPNTLGKWHPTKSAVTTHLSSSVKLPIRSPNIALALDISCYINAYFHLNYLFRDKIWGMRG